MTTDAYVLNNHVIYHNPQELVDVYSKQGNWEQKHTDLILSGIAQLVPGQQMVLSQYNFIASGEDEEGEWEDKMKYPHVIQRTDAEVFKLYSTRCSLKDKVDELDAKIKELTLERNAYVKQFSRSESNMQKYGKTVGKPIKVEMKEE